MTTPVRFSQLSPSWQKLVRIMQSLNYGSILNFPVTNGEPSLDPEPEVLLDVRLDEDVVSRAELNLGDFDLSAEMRRLFARIVALKNGSAEKITVHAGLPRRVILRPSLSQNAHKEDSNECPKR
jgi:hypothetical protein